MGGVDLAKRNDPVHHDDEGWWFWNEVFADRYGPYPDELTARQQLFKYVREVLCRPKEMGFAGSAWGQPYIESVDMGTHIALQKKVDLWQEDPPGSPWKVVATRVLNDALAVTEVFG